MPIAGTLPAILIATLGCVGTANPCPTGQVPDEVTGACVVAVVPEPDMGPPVPCSPTDITAWASLFASPDLGTEIAECAEEAFCLPQLPCRIGACLADAAGLQGCDACAELQAGCASSRCRSACVFGTHQECQACMCDAGCVAAFEACAATDLNVCEGVHGRDSTAEERVLERPILIRRKSMTGFTRAAEYVEETGEWVDLRTSYAAVGWTSLVTFTVADVDYLLEFMGACGDDTCPWRISPVLRTAELGRPVASGRWSSGWDVFEVFVLDGATYFLQYKSGTLRIDDEPLGATRVFRVDPGVTPGLSIAEAATSIQVTPSGRSWTHVAAFRLGDAVYLALHRAGEGEAGAYAEVEQAGSAPSLVAAAGDSWVGGWDLIDAFPIGERWFLMQYAATGSVRISELSDGTGAVIAATSFEAVSWPTELSRTLAFRTNPGTVALRQSEGRGTVDGLAFSANPDLWGTTGLGDSLGTDSWGVVPPWDTVELAGRRIWANP